MLSIPEEEEKFRRSAETGRTYRTHLGWDGEPTASVRALGHISSAQFTMMARPTEYGRSWLELDESRGQAPGVMDFGADTEEYKTLEQQILKEGVRRPVIIGDKTRTLLPGTASRPTRLSRGNFHPVLDGHHRAFIAIKHGLHIPVAHAKGW